MRRIIIYAVSRIPITRRLWCIKWEGYAFYIEKRSEKDNFSPKTEEQKQLEKPRHRCKDDKKDKKTGYETVKWNPLAQDRVQ